MDLIFDECPGSMFMAMNLGMKNMKEKKKLENKY